MVRFSYYCSYKFKNYKKLQQELENIRDYIRGEYVPKTQYG